MNAAETTTVPPRADDLSGLSAYARVLADRMGLRDWTVEVSGDLPDLEFEGVNETGFVAFDRPSNRKHATFGVTGNFFASSPEDRRLYVVYELLYCHFDGPRALMSSLGVSRVIRFEQGMASGLTVIAAAWAPALPLPLVGWMARAKDEGEGER